MLVEQTVVRLIHELPACLVLVVNVRRHVCVGPLSSFNNLLLTLVAALCPNMNAFHALVLHALLPVVRRVVPFVGPVTLVVVALVHAYSLLRVRHETCVVVIELLRNLMA